MKRTTATRRRSGAILCLTAVLQAGCSNGSQPGEAGISGEELFIRHCAGCHPGGKNIIYPQKDLRYMTLMANGITKPEDIVAVMRNPGAGMTRFDREVITDDEARKIAFYVMSAFR